MRHIQVTCAIIERYDGLVFAAQRSAQMSMALKWEFPGGKINPGESAIACVQRELIEELNITVCIIKSLPQSTHKYPSFTVTLHPFICSITSGVPVLHEHISFCWRKPEKLIELDWAAADIPVLKSYLSQRAGSVEP